MQSVYAEPTLKQTPIKAPMAFEARFPKVCSCAGLLYMQAMTRESHTCTQAAPDAIDLMRKLLVFNPGKRITIDQALTHPYVAKFYNPAYVNAVVHIVQSSGTRACIV